MVPDFNSGKVSALKVSALNKDMLLPSLAVIHGEEQDEG